MPDELAPSELSTSLEEVRDDRAVLRVAGEVDLLTAPVLRDALASALVPGRVVIADLGDVTFVDSTGLRTLLEAHRAAADAGGGLALRAPAGGAAARLLDLAGVRDLFLEDPGGAPGA